MKNKLGNYVTAALMMSLAWSLRGQFGHLKGAMIPGVFAALLAAFFYPRFRVRSCFGWLVLMCATGFAAGGELAYGKLIDSILATSRFRETGYEFMQIFLTGAIWGGVGLTYMGFGLSEGRGHKTDRILLLLVMPAAFLILLVSGFDHYARIFLLAVYICLHVYNALIKKSLTISFLGACGFLGFGLAFVAAVVLLYAGVQGYIPEAGRWWALRDQMIGAAAGLLILFVLNRVLLTEPEREAGEETSFATKAGLLVILVWMPVINSLNLVDYWYLELERISTGRVIAVLFILGLLFGVLGGMVLRSRPHELSSAAWMNLLRFSALFAAWYLSVAAILKQVVPYGLVRWETGFSLFLFLSMASSILLCLSPDGEKRRA